MSKLLPFFKSNVLPFLCLTFGALLAAFSIEEFLVPVTILDGGIVGVSMIIAQLTRWPLGLLTFLLNVPFLVLGLKNIGTRFLLSAVYAMALFSATLGIFERMHNATAEPLLAVVFGGVLLGAGVGLVLRGGGCLDGTETVALLISKKTHLSTGQIIFLFNILIYGTAGFLFGWDRAMYSLLTYFVSFKVIDMVEEGLEQAKSVMIISNDGDKIADAIYRRIGRTCTRIQGQGHITGEKAVLYCVVTRVELHTVRRIIRDADESAFVTISDVSEIVGNHVKRTPDPVPVAPDAQEDFPENGGTVTPGTTDKSSVAEGSDADSSDVESSTETNGQLFSAGPDDMRGKSIESGEVP